MGSRPRGVVVFAAMIVMRCAVDRCVELCPSVGGYEYAEIRCVSGTEYSYQMFENLCHDKLFVARNLISASSSNSDGSGFASVN